MNGSGNSRKKAEKGKIQRKENGVPNINGTTSMDDEEKSDQPRSEYGVRNASRSRPTRKKEEDTETKTTRR